MKTLIILLDMMMVELTFSFSAAILKTVSATPFISRHGLVFGSLAQAIRQRELLYGSPEEFLYLHEKTNLTTTHERDGRSEAVSACCSPYAVNIILSVVWDIVVDDHLNIVDVDAAGNNVGGHKHVNVPVLETMHDLVALALVEVGMHLTTTHFHAHQVARDILDLALVAGEDDDTLELLFFKEVAQNAQLLIVVAHVGHLADIVGRLADGKFHHGRILEERFGQLLDFGRHGG